MVKFGGSKGEWMGTRSVSLQQLASRPVQPRLKKRPFWRSCPQKRKYSSRFH